MKSVLKNTTVLGVFLLGTLGMASAALAWSSYASFDVEAAGVRFSGAEMSSPNSGKHQCTIRVRLKANVPDTNARNLLVVIDTKAGKSIVKSVRWVPKRTGTQWVDFSYDTTHRECWASQIQTATKLSVRGCQGDDCKP